MKTAILSMLVFASPFAEANAAVDSFALAADGKRFNGKNNRGQRVEATRLE